MRCRAMLLTVVVGSLLVASCVGGESTETTPAGGATTSPTSTTAPDVQLPSITFDGTTAVYSGPAEVAAYPPVQAFRLVNDSDTSVDFGYSAIKPDEFEGVTEQDAIEWGLTNVDNPPWLENPSHFARHVLAGETVEVDAAFIAGKTYELWVWKTSTQTGHFAAWIDAVASDD